MKRIKVTIMSLAILLSVGGAFATKLHMDCRFATQYYYNGVGYIPITGDLGTTYLCMSAPSTCTYYQVAGGYAACQLGQYVSIGMAGQ
jgi:hypothetical protein